MDAVSKYSWVTECPHLRGTTDDPCLAICESEGENAVDLMAAVRLGLEDEGRRVRARFGDDRRDPTTARILAETLAGEGVQYVIGHFGSVVARTASVVYAQHGILYLAPGSSSPDLCGPHASTTLQFFGTDLEQADCLASVAGALDVPTVVFAERNNYGAILARTLVERLAPRLTQLQVIYGYRHGAAMRQGMTRPGRVIILGSREFAQRIVMLNFVKESEADLLLSDDSFTPSLLASGIPLARSRVAFMERNGEILIDRPASHVRGRASKLYGRPPGPYFETAYIAVRALSQAWSEVGPADVRRVQERIMRQTWPSPFGMLSLSASCRLVGHRWNMIPVSSLIVAPQGQVA